MTLNDRIGGVIMDEKKCWLVVCVQSNREKKTYERLSALGFESFLPLQEETRRWSDRSKKVQRVVIPMVVFARIAPSERISVLRLPSVSRFMVLRGSRMHKWNVSALCSIIRKKRLRCVRSVSSRANR